MRENKKTGQWERPELCPFQPGVNCNTACALFDFADGDEAEDPTCVLERIDRSLQGIANSLSRLAKMQRKERHAETAE